MNEEMNNFPGENDPEIDPNALTEGDIIEMKYWEDRLN